MNNAGFLASGGEEFNPGPVIRLTAQSFCVIKIYLSIKEIEKIEIRRGQKRVSLLFFSRKVHSY